MTRNSTTSRPSTESDTAIKKNRWLRLAAPKAELPELENLLDLYWGGPERRITGLTLRIVAVNAAALVMLLVGMLYLGQYQNSLIEARLETFNAETGLIAAALSEGAASTGKHAQLLPQQIQGIAQRLSLTAGKRIYVFDEKGHMIADSQTPSTDSLTWNHSLSSVQTLKNMAGLILKIIPDRRVLRPYPEPDSKDAADYPGVLYALRGEITMAAWLNKQEKVFLTATAPLYKDGHIIGALYLTRPAGDIERDIGEVWLNVLTAFGITLVLTVLLSIYLSGIIAQPLRKLAKAAESVRKGKATASEIPDFSHRRDEIGELSIVLREMTQALWERMDSTQRFAADVAHELKNPLTSLRSAVETAAVVKKPKDRDKLMEIIHHDIERLDRLITDISNISRLEAELSQESFTRVSLCTLLSGLIDVYKDPLQRQRTYNQGWHNTANTEGKKIILDASVVHDIHAWGIESRLAQVFQNLIANALSFSPPGSTVYLHVTPMRRQAIITVEDEGPGIPETRLETIFERFYSERPQHEAYGKHSGLGLSICRQIINALGGRIFAENIQDEKGQVQGARFTVILNLA